MAAEVVMPKLGMAMKEGTVSTWNKKVGDSVSKGDMIASINSEKIEMDIEAPQDGVILDILVQEDVGVPPGTIICYVGKPNEQLTEQNRSANELQAPKNEVAAAISLEEPPANTASSKKNKETVRISPIARKIAESENINIETIQGTGPKGRITKADVEKVLAERASESSPQTVERDNPAINKETLPVAGMRKVIASRMHNSLLNSAQLTINMKADVTDLLSLQREIKDVTQQRHKVKISLTDFIARAVVLSLQEHKQMNSAYIDNEIQLNNHVHLGMAVALENGLVVPVVQHAEKMSLVELATEIKTRAADARQGQLSTDRMQGSTFTITNLGAYGVEYFTPVLNPPETGILGVGATEDVPMYKGDELQKRNLLPLSLTFDHRVLDGAPAANFLGTIKQYLEQPILLLL
ncbi:dihydrolipoamide acetyltransferase family protein [Priestia megaterium]|jgi:pyruvate dehydrogenase E2 component (dihydrolipoamide acetyltransferase)|uniref:Dihydrolipoamide acetyltransferase component of pyruvate dehydrogenase complex n=1 Tax=Priestia megaterium TaxID=1404 RepID=A0AAE5UAM2_PRIMG|nr:MULTISPECIES: dihydrolipoamide acetyltransferase family protein [Priestia]RFB30120.1 2-oxo acid dehydrogenase subunit E2 [Bacillus sp. ALD]RFB40486.1 2-oxo acid dehydrogenase subunit E2 [Bacillus sp. RC]MBM6601334.1 2-oxo acid dehydrogenase subunit E2 [Priestia megaterium]MBV6734487.1 2-oxo acid dehydrogenase subunit E2 [Priestia megaterium]MBW0928422.1 2-oxo acid dehydrogenase subunit E2 [Priestia megaterium]